MLPRLLVGWLGLLLIMLPVLTACQSARQGQTKLNSTGSPLGISDTNPNNPLGSSYRTYEADVDVMRTALSRHYPNMTVNAIRVNGTKVHIQLQALAGTSERELRSLEEEVVRMMATESPRYETRVTITAP
ncbi:hypothetical protein SAMN02799630_02382 [Paenibacillus sp. UNCCL117]|uniref:hypothetical protein n=1 Tax=unclassified Paenibacillus TaxID=185978 RepID=UPI00088C469C|nr:MULTISPECIES: hypothetical protein [unclassified Paenibacillus]SDD19470.1 hypothetical protein SAMN04488602_106258 [Paenibacillus sp. cl123]SFW35546.1 hypothetical protein SAMN02799630_02382 [Paenibacillus sp. UNCCL117]